MKQILGFLLLMGVTAILVGCKLAVIVVEGGEVQSTGSGTCAAGTICMVNVADTNFSETFTAVPDDGWYFHKWNRGGRFFCGDSTNPLCTLSFQGYEESARAENMVASSEMFYLMPIFKPFQDTVTIEGKEWLQPDLFANLSWKKINAACPAGACSGMLNGYDMTGWTWASVDDFNRLPNYYLDTDVGPDPYTSEYSSSSEWAYTFLKDGWRTEPYGVAEGWLRNLSDEKNAYYASIQAFLLYEDRGPPINSVAGSIDTIEDEIFHKFVFRGGWFYRTN